MEEVRDGYITDGLLIHVRQRIARGIRGNLHIIPRPNNPHYNHYIMNPHQERVIYALTKKDSYSSFSEFSIAYGYKGGQTWNGASDSLQRAIMHLKMAGVVSAKVWKKGRRTFFFIGRGPNWETPKEEPVERSKLEQGLALIAESMRDTIASEIEEEWEEKLALKQKQIEKLSGQYGAEVARSNKLQKSLDERSQKSYISKMFGLTK